MKENGFGILGLIVVVAILGVLAYFVVTPLLDGFSGFIDDNINENQEVIENNEDNKYGTVYRYNEQVFNDWVKDNVQLDSSYLPSEIGDKTTVTLATAINEMNMAPIYDHNYTECYRDESYITIIKTDDNEYEFRTTLVCESYTTSN